MVDYNGANGFAFTHDHMSNTVTLVTEVFATVRAFIRGYAEVDTVVMIVQVPAAEKCFLTQVTITGYVFHTAS